MGEGESSDGRAALRVLEIAEGVAGPACGRLFAALGHDVIKCEAPTGDPLRRREPTDDRGCSFAFTALNADKRSLVVDLDGDGHGTLDELLGRADVVITDLAPRRAAAVGLDVGGLRRRWPHLVVVSVTAFGLDAPFADQPGDSLLAECYGGLAQMIGEPSREPLSLGGEQAEHAAAFAAFLGALLALRHRDRAGHGDANDPEDGGDLVEVAACDVAAWLDWKSAVTCAVTGDEPQRTGASVGRWRTVAAADGWIGVIFQPEQWGALVDLVGDARLADPELADEGVRAERAPQWWRVIEAWARSRPKREIYEEAQRRALAFGYCADMADVSTSSQLLARGFLSADVGPGDRPSTGALFRSSGLTWRSGAAPALDDHHGGGWLDDSTSSGPRQPGQPGRPDPGQGQRWPLPGTSIRGTAPLAGVRVLDLGTITAGAAVGRLLADYGATVVKVESLEHPDSFRQWVVDGVTVSGDGSTPVTSPLFDSNNAGKRGVTLDLTSEAGRGAMEGLVTEADVLVENFRVGVTDRLGIDAARSQALNPALVYLSLSSQGQDGPEAGYRSYGSTLDLLSGLASVTGYLGDRPIWSSAEVNYPDQLVSLIGAAVVVYCLERGVRGAHVDVAQREVVSWTLSDRIAQQRSTGEVAGPTGNRRPGRTPHDTYRCEGTDQWIAIACSGAAHRLALAALIGETDPSADDERWWWGAQDQVDQRITAWTQVRTKARCVRELRAARVPCAPVLSASERSSDPHFATRRVFLEDGPPLKGFPLRLGGYAPPRPSSAPALGERDGTVLSSVEVWG